MRPVDQDIRDFVTTAIDRSIALSAGAGSGKTSLLASRVVHLLVEGDRDPGRVAEHMRTRGREQELIGNWVNVTKPSEPDALWFAEPPENWVDNTVRPK